MRYTRFDYINTYEYCINIHVYDKLILSFGKIYPCSSPIYELTCIKIRYDAYAWAS